MAKKRTRTKRRTGRRKQAKVKKILPSPKLLQNASSAVLRGKISLSPANYGKLKKHKTILRKLARMKGTQKRKQNFVSRNRKQVGGFLPLLPLILAGIGAAGSAAGGVAAS